MSDYWRMSAAEIAKAVNSKEISALEITRDALARLESVNPKINAVVQEMPEQALEAARRVDAKIASGAEVGSLAGVPVTIKVNVDQQGFATTNGTRLQENLIAEHDSPVVSNLEKAGAIVIGRTNTPAFSLRWFTRNQLHGQTLNPHNFDITPGGSSGGAASATAAGIGAIGHGTDIAGSVRYPAYACGLHGLRPSFGRVPAANLSAPDRHIGGQLMAVSGPLARTLEDVRLAYEAMARGDIRDPWWVSAQHEFPKAQKRVALCYEPSGLKTSNAVKDALKDAASRLEKAGWELEEVACPDMQEPARLQAVLWMAEFRRGAEKMVLEEADQDAVFVYEQMLRRCPEPNLNDVLDCLQTRVTLMREWALFFEKYPILLCPNSAEPPFPNNMDVQGADEFDHVFEAQLPQIAPPFLGLPGLSVATSIATNNTPMGVQLIANRFREDILFQAGLDIESSGPAFPVVDPK